MTEKKTLLITSMENLAWYKELESVIQSLNGQIEPLSYLKISKIDWGKYDLVFLDLANINDPITLIQSINQRFPEVTIVAFSPVPRWKQAREMMHAGANDYLARSGEFDYLYQALKHNFLPKK